MDSKTCLVIISDKSCLGTHKHNDDPLMFNMKIESQRCSTLPDHLNLNFKLSKQDAVIVKLGFQGTERHQ